MSQSILIVDDDPVQRRLLEEMIKRAGHVVRQADGGEAALAALTGPGGQDIALVVLDLVMPDLDGMGVLEAMAKQRLRKPVIVQTAKGGIDTVVSAMRAGATDFVVKPVNPERLQVSIRNALKVNALEGEIVRIQRKVEGSFTFKDIVTRSPAMARVMHVGGRAASSTIPVLIEGESGVGKELIARAIQGSGNRAGKPFVTVNCGAIPSNLVESILFGHEKGAFTGAQDKHVGKFAEADGGTLFLDEVSELPLDTQVKLLRAIQEGEIDPVGARKPVKVNIRLISATNRNMLELVREGKFREDLYYRLNVFPVAVPPLRARLEDVPGLANHFLTRFAAEEGKALDGIDPEALAMLQRYDWPGNVRQLENAVFRAVVLADGPRLSRAEFPQIMAQLGEDPRLHHEVGMVEPVQPGPVQPTSVQAPPVQAPPVQAPPVQAPPVQAPPVQANVSAPASAGPGQALPDAGLGVPASMADGWAPSPGVAPGANFLNALNPQGELRALEEIEAELIRFALDHYKGHMSEVARRLNIGRSTLYRKVRELGLDDVA